MGDRTDRAVNIFEAARDVILEDSTLHVHLCEYLVSHRFMLVYSSNVLHELVYCTPIIVTDT